MLLAVVNGIVDNSTAIATTTCNCTETDDDDDGNGDDGNAGALQGTTFLDSLAIYLTTGSGREWDDVITNERFFVFMMRALMGFHVTTSAVSP